MILLELYLLNLVLDKMEFSPIWNSCEGEILLVISSCACVDHAVCGGCECLVLTCPVLFVTQSTGWEVGG